MPNVTIYHNPRCSKSRQTLALLQAHAIEPTIIDYLKTPPDAKQLQHLVTLLGMTPRELMRQREPLYKSLNLANPNLTHTQLLQALADNPSLIERPIVVHGQRAVIGRPPENVLEII